MEETEFDYKADYIKMINEDLEHMTTSELAKTYKWIRRNIIQNTAPPKN